MNNITSFSLRMVIDGKEYSAHGQSDSDTAEHFIESCVKPCVLEIMANAKKPEDVAK